MKSMHRAAGLVHVLGLNPMSVIAVQVRTDVRQASTRCLRLDNSQFAEAISFITDVMCNLPFML